MKRSLRPFIALSVAGLFAIATALPSEAGPLTFDLNYNFGTVNAGGDVIVTIVDASGNVTITVTNNSQGFINDLFLNYSPSDDIETAPVATFSGGVLDVSQPGVQFALQGFAIAFAYQTANNDPGRFGPGEMVTFDLDASVALTADGVDINGGGLTRR